MHSCNSVHYEKNTLILITLILIITICYRQLELLMFDVTVGRSKGKTDTTTSFFHRCHFSGHLYVCISIQRKHSLQITGREVWSFWKGNYHSEIILLKSLIYDAHTWGILLYICVIT